MKLTRIVAVLLLCAVLLCACGTADADGEQTSETLPPVTQPIDTYEWRTVETDAPVDPDPEIALDLHVLPAHYDSVCTTADRLAYAALIDAAASREETVVLDEVSFGRVEGFARRSVLGALLTDMTYDAAAGQVRLTYALEADAHVEAIGALSRLCAVALTRAAIAADAPEAETVYAIYREVIAQSFSYDEPLPLILSDGALTENALSELFVFLLLQKGIPALTLSGDVCAAAAMIGGEWYLFLPSYEIMDDSGNFLWYFGMTDAEAADAGIASLAPDVPDFWKTYKPKPPVIPEDTAEPGTDEPDGGEDTAPADTTPPEPIDPAEVDRAYEFVLTCTSARFAPLRLWDGCTLTDHVLHGVNRETGEEESIAL